ncbi:hypothetical protein LCGC14_2151120 [marine sediment metagenome]|uniref:Uncharacterized protein n=1 Tax=marine sediment metagenome TaxID=412755 RepID=A0A0F9G8L2_9ZZZZ
MDASTKGKCFECGLTCGQEEFCFGCRVFVCDECSLNCELMRGHEPEDHLNDPADLYGDVD